MSTPQRVIISLVAAGIAATLAVSGLMAQGPIEPPQQPSSDSEETTRPARERVEERVRIMRAWRLTEILSLDEGTALALFELLDTYDQEVLPTQAALGQHARSLRQMLSDGSGSDAEITELTNSIMESHLRMEQAKIDLIESSASVLDPRQQAILMLFLPEFDREVRQAARELRRGRRGEGPGPGVEGERPGPGEFRGPRGDRGERGDRPGFRRRDRQREGQFPPPE